VRILTPTVRWLIGLRIASPAFVLAVSLGATATARAAETAPKPDFDIPAGDALVSLKAWANQSSQEIVYRADDVRGVHTNAVVGKFTPADALDLMLEGTELEASRSPSGLLSVRRAVPPKAERAARQAAPGSDQASEQNYGGSTVVLDPFNVKTSQDTSYGALNSNSITRFNTPLANVSVSDDIFTQQFMRDVGATSVQDMLLEYGAGTGQVYPVQGSASIGQPGDQLFYSDRFSSLPMGGRGLSIGFPQLDGFQSFQTNVSSTSNFAIDRVEVLHGPQALLYGAGGVGGTIEMTSKPADFNRTFGSVTATIDQYGSKRELVDENVGTNKFAFRLALLDQDQQQYRLLLDDKTHGIYGQAAFLLPLHSTLRLIGEYTTDNRPVGTGAGVNFGSTAADPRNGYNLGYLILTGQTGAINPSTGQPYSTFGAIDNGHLNWRTVNSFAGWTDDTIVKDYTYTINLDTVWTPWLSTNVGANFDRQFFDAMQGTAPSLTAPGVAGNPFNDWAVNSTMSDTTNTKKEKNYQASALITKDFFGGIAKTQSVFGAQREWLGDGVDDFGYYLSDAQGHVVENPATFSNNLGRSPMPAQWWDIGGGPVARPLFAPLSPVVSYNGNYYARMEKDPSSPAWTTPYNPLGVAALYPGFNNASGATTVGGNGTSLNVAPFAKQYLTAAYYAGNYTSWWHDLFTTLVGLRYTKVGFHVANGGAAIGSTSTSAPYDAHQVKNVSYNLGVDGRITDWLRWYANDSSTYDNSIGFDDPYGNPPPVSHGAGQEFGFKFNPADSRVSGSLAYYQTRATGQNIGLGSSPDLAIINPSGINGIYNGPAGRDAWIPMNQASNGAELMLTAAPTKNWRLRFVATDSEGKVRNTSSYGILYNDQFYTDGKGNVTYGNGQPFMVPVNPGTNVSSISSPTNPTSLLASGPTEQLTTAMISNPTNPYYAYGVGNAQSPGGQLTGTYVVDALKWFQLPGPGGQAGTGVTGLPISDIQYAWTNPDNFQNNQVTIFTTGQHTTGYPVYRASLTSAYDFTEGALKGIGLVASFNDSWQWFGAYYTNPANGGQATLYELPNPGLTVDLHPYYQRKFGRILWRTQLDVFNVFNHYAVVITPNPQTGFTNALTVGTSIIGTMRRYQWTNTLSY